MGILFLSLRILESLSLKDFSKSIAHYSLPLPVFPAAILAGSFPITFFSPMVRLFSVMWLQYRKF